jgi:hypothetical protein
MTRTKTKSKMIPVINCGGETGRAVVFGWVDTEPVIGEQCRMTDARMILWWSSECGGLMGLASDGPKTATRITATVPVAAHTTRQWMRCSDSAAAAIAAWPSC